MTEHKKPSERMKERVEEAIRHVGEWYGSAYTILGQQEIDSVRLDEVVKILDELDERITKAERAATRQVCELSAAVLALLCEKRDEASGREPEPRLTAKEWDAVQRVRRGENE